MDWNRLKEPSLIVSTVTLLLLVCMLLFNRTNSRLEKIEAQIGSLNASGNGGFGLPNDEDSQDQFSDAISLATAHLEEEKFLDAYDLILLSSRLRPSDPRLFDVLLDFVEQAYRSEDEESLMLADDLLSRGESLIHFQSPSDVGIARRRFSTAAAKSMPKSSTTEVIPFAEVNDFLAVAENQDVSAEMRSLAIERARMMLEDALLLSIVSDRDMPPEYAAAETKLRQRIDSVEKTCLGLLFNDVRERSNAWLADVDEVLKASESVGVKSVPEAAKRISHTVDVGVGILQELAPYARSEIPESADLEKQIEKQIAVLQRTKAWLYNQQVLRLIRDLESREDWPIEDKVRYLAEASEEHLTPYVLRRYTEFWEKLFEELDEDKKVWAVKMRILHAKDSK